MVELPSWKTINHACIVFEPGSSMKYRTGDWRSMRPEIDRGKCVRCRRCWMYCPDAAIIIDEGDNYSVDYEYCKGCGICSYECPKDAIAMMKECE